MNHKSFPTRGVALGILGILLLIGLIELSSGVSPMVGTVLLFGVIAIVVGMFFVFVMLSWQGSHRDSVAYRQVRDFVDGNKPKRGENLAQLMEALSDNDLYELRQHIKGRLMAQADAGDDDEFETFEALLADVEDKRKRG